MTFKENVYDQYAALLSGKIKQLQTALDELKESGKNETKSTAGDKHETALAMLQIEQENKRTQLAEALTQQVQLSLIDIHLSVQHVIKGSLVRTNKGFLFLSVALGRMVVDGETVFALSPQSPLGARLMSLGVGASAEVNGVVYTIEALL